MQKDRKKVLLLVDDSRLILQMEETILGHEKFEFLRAMNAKDALELCKKEKPALILLDYFLPDKQGDEVAKEIRNDSQIKNTSIIIVTTGGSDEQKEKCFRAGCNDFIAKPIDAGVLKLKVDRLINIPPRAPFRILVKISQIGTERHEFVFGSSVNISTTGILVETEKKFDVGSEVALQFYVTTSREPILARGIIVRSQKKGFRKVNAYGITFVEISDADKAKIEDLIGIKIGQF